MTQVCDGVEAMQASRWMGQAYLTVDVAFHRK